MIDQFEQHILTAVPEFKNLEAREYLLTLLSIIDRGIHNTSLKKILLDILLHETNPRFFVMTATKSGPVTNTFLSTNPGSEIYHVLSMCLMVNRQLQMEPLFNIPVEIGKSSVRRDIFEQALVAICLHDSRKCGGLTDWDETKSDPYHGDKAASVFSNYAQTKGIDTKTITHVTAAIRYHDGRFSPLIKEKYRDTQLSLYEIMLNETGDKEAALLSTVIHSLDMATSNGLVPPPSENQRKKFLSFLLEIDGYLVCAS